VLKGADVNTETLLEVIYLRVSFRAMLFRKWRSGHHRADVDQALNAFFELMANAAPVA